MHIHTELGVLEVRMQNPLLVINWPILNECLPAFMTLAFLNSVMGGFHTTVVITTNTACMLSDYFA